MKYLIAGIIFVFYSGRSLGQDTLYIEKGLLLSYVILNKDSTFKWNNHDGPKYKIEKDTLILFSKYRADSIIDFSVCVGYVNTKLTTTRIDDNNGTIIIKFYDKSLKELFIYNSILQENYSLDFRAVEYFQISTFNGAYAPITKISLENAISVYFHIDYPGIPRGNFIGVQKFLINKDFIYYLN